VADPPSIACPVDVTVSGVTGTTQTITYTAPTVTAGTTPVAVTCSPSSGEGFPLGSTSVRCTAVDAGARQATCNFNVTLKGFNIGVKKYMAYGDSVTEGQNGLPELSLTFVDPPNSYPTKLLALLEGSFPNQGVTMSNRGVGGLRAEVSRDQMPAVLAQEKPGSVLLISGYNNLLGECPIGVGSIVPLCASEIEKSVGALREMVRMARVSGANPVFVGTITPSGPVIPPTKNRQLLPAAVTSLNAKIKAQIPGEGGTVVDIYPLFLGHEAEYSGPDGLHLLPPGNQAIANGFFTAIKATVPQTPAFGVAR
jgi:lysophospholipase L1-like esterase